MPDLLVNLAVGIFASAIGTTIGTVAGVYIYNRWIK